MYRCVIIHLDSAVERMPLMEKLRKILIHTVEVYSAKDGTEWEKSSKIAKKHPREQEPVSRGILGCAHSHIDVIHGTLKGKQQFCLIFEDDCEILATQDSIYGFIHYAKDLPAEWDMILLGASEYVESEKVNERYTKVQRFWGTHAVILKEKAMRAVLQTFADAQKEGIFLPADWMYNEAIKKHGLTCYGPTQIDQLCQQKPGLVSAITGKPRIAPKPATKYVTMTQPK
jgi:GR25 family glycosyltransferase involved in LPS biosynthesis